jgi:PAS domain S-box-containing protein
MSDQPRPEKAQPEKAQPPKAQPPKAQPPKAQPPKAQRESSEQLRLLVEQVQDYAIFLIDPEGRVASWNAGAERINGYRADEIIGKPYATFFLEEDRAAGNPDRQMRRAREQGRVEDEGWRQRKDGSRFWADAVLTTLYDADGRLRGYAKVTRDMTERRQLEEQRNLIEALQTTAEARDQALAQVGAERALLEAVVRQMPAGLVIAEAPTGKLVLGNEQVEQVRRQPFLASANIEEYEEYHGFHPDGRPYWPEEWPLARALQTGEVVTDEEVEIERGDGTRGTVLISSSPVRDRRGRIVAGVVTFTFRARRPRPGGLGMHGPVHCSTP